MEIAKRRIWISAFEFALLLILISAGGCGNRGSKWEPKAWYPADETIRLNEIQLKGTHNSYHIAPLKSFTQEWDYTHAPIYEQLEERGVRQIELDVHYVTDAGRFRVFHIPFLDEGSTCYWFTDCLQEVKRWSNEHPWHLPIVIFIEPKDDADIIRITPYEPIKGHYSDLEDEILSVFPIDRIFTPDELMGYHSSLSEAIEQEGWPTLDKVRGRVIFVMLDRGEHRRNYTYGGVTLQGRLMFVTAEVGAQYSAVFSIDDPLRNQELISSLVEKGFIVRTRADALKEAWQKDFSRQQAALESGAQIISTDYPIPGMIEGYYFELPGGVIARCNPVASDSDCSSDVLETPEGP